MRNGDFSGFGQPASGWLPQSVVNQFTGIAPPPPLVVNDSAIYQQYNVNNGQFTPITLCTATRDHQLRARLSPFPGNKIPQSMLDSHRDQVLKYIALPDLLPQCRQTASRISSRRAC